MSTRVAILSVRLDTFKDSETELVKLYVKYVRNPNIFSNYGKFYKTKKKKKKEKKKESLRTIPVPF